MSDFNTRIINATKWAAITEIFAKVISPVTNMVLARILTPDIFGIVASISIVFSFCDMLADAGFQKFIVQKECDSERMTKYVTVAFWAHFFFSIFIFVLIVVFSNQLATLVGCENKNIALIVASMSLPLTAYSSIQTALLKRDLNFKPLFYVRIVTVFVPIFVTLPLAYFTRSYWALILGTLSTNIATVVLMFLNFSFKPRFYFKMSVLKEILSFSLWSLLESFLVWIINWGDVFIVSNLLESYYLGLYKTSMNMINSLVAVISGALVPVVLSALSRSQNNQLEFKNVYYKFSLLSGMILIPLGTGIFIYREFICKVILGEAWSEASSFIGIWGLISAIAILFNSYNGNVLIAKGKPNISVFVQVIQIIFIIPVVYYSCKESFEYLSYSRSLVRIVGMIVYSVVVWKIAEISLLANIRNLMPSIIGSLVMGVCGYNMLKISGNMLQCSISIVVCIIIYAIVICLFSSTRKLVKSFLDNFSH